MSTVDNNWNCSKCSFSNHADLSCCEICESERDIPTSQSSIETHKLDNIVSNFNSSSFIAEKTTFQMDDCSCTSGIIELLQTMLVKDRLSYSLSWPNCSHFSQRNSFGASWSCGYRNVQMISSALMQIPAYRERIFSGKGRMPNIRIIQQWIEKAWKEGFDTEGCSHFKGKLVGTKDWIGTTECCALLRFFGIRARIVDFHPHNYENKRKLEHDDAGSGKGSSSSGKSPSETDPQIQSHIGQWLKQYYQSKIVPAGSNKSGTNLLFSVSSSSSKQPSVEPKSFLPPLYFQHDGHSRTIIGITVEKDEVDALVLDPACSGQLIVKNLQESIDSVRGAKKWQRQLRRPMSRFNKSEYQILYIEEGFMSQEERERSKVIDGISFSNQFYET